MDNTKFAAEVADAVRLFFVTTDGLHRQFLYFSGRGDDIYWGEPGRGSIHSTIVKQVDTALQITVGDEEVSDVAVKASYHRSGQAHLKVANQMTSAGPLHQTPPASLTDPIRSGWIITKPPVFYAEYQKKLPSKAAVFVHMDSETEQRRMSCEIFFTPPGTHQFPALGSDKLHDRTPDFAVTVTARLLVVGWISPLDEGFSAWQQNKSIMFMGKIFEQNAD
jgi:hypothetical protein